MAKIGIDFGTTNSLVVSYDKNKHEFIYYNYLSNVPTPISSTVWYHDDIVEVGRTARENINKYSDVDGHHFEKSIKSFLGTEKVKYIFGEPVRPYEIASTILKKVKDTAFEEYHAEYSGADFSKAVFTVPINFSGKARNDLRKSANDAGIEVTTFIHEPFAAIIGYYFSSITNSYNDVIQKLNSLEGQYLLTFDWGGGTLDITVVAVNNGKMHEIGTAELSGIAGDEFDKKLANYCWNKFCDSLPDKYSFAYLEKCKRQHQDKLLSIAEKCKIDLSIKNEAEFLLPNAVDLEDIYETITRDEFNNLINEAIEESCSKINEALSIAGIDSNDISHVLLTGGSCYIPEVQKRIRQQFGHRVELVTNPDLVIAQGAAVIAELGWLPFLTKDIQVQLCDDSYWPIFEHGMPISSDGKARNSEMFTCVDQREGIAKIIISEGIEQTRDKILAVMKVPVLNDRRFGDDILVEASIDNNIVMNIKAYSKMSHGYSREEKYSIRKTSEIYQLCFGLDFGD